MQHIKLHIAFRVMTLLLVFTLVMPSVVKFSHVFEHHQHEVCNGETTTHLHKQDIDCEFFKFKLATPFTIPHHSVEIFIPQHTFLKSDVQYAFLSDYQRLHFSLRGPPQINLI